MKILVPVKRVVDYNVKVRVKADGTGVETADDVAAYLLAGADVVMTTSALLRHGPGHVTALLDGLTALIEASRAVISEDEILSRVWK